jgi:hypothetical protein
MPLSVPEAWSPMMFRQGRWWLEIQRTLSMKKYKMENYHDDTIGEFT